LFLHSDAVCDPSAVRMLVEEAYRSNAAIVGPKVVEWDDPTRLLSAGVGSDKFGEPAPGAYSTRTARMLLPGTFGNSCSKTTDTFARGSLLSSAATVGANQASAADRNRTRGQRLGWWSTPMAGSAPARASLLDAATIATLPFDMAVCPL
jgi:hypothetical protein